MRSRLRRRDGRTIRVFLLLSIVAAAAFIAAPASASADTVWNLDIHHNETNFPPGGTAEYWVEVTNVGSTDSDGLVTLKVNLPSGVTRDSVRIENLGSYSPVSWSCPGSSGATSFTCTTSGSIRRHASMRNLILAVDIAPGSSGVRFATASVSGGGATEAASTFEPTSIASSPADFGIVDGSWRADFFESDGLTPVRQAGAHPDIATFGFDMNSTSKPAGEDTERKAPAGTLRNASIRLPEGFVGNPTSVAECEPAEFLASACPPESQVGRADFTITPISAGAFTVFSQGVFNLSPGRGTIADLGFVALGNPVHVKASLDPTDGYAVKTKVSDINESLPLFNQRVTIWGVPSDPAHDSERCQAFSEPGGTGGSTEQECPSSLPERPFLTTPFDCQADHEMTLSRYDSWQNTGVFGPDITYNLPGHFTGCENVPFEPSISVAPTETSADTPTGLDVTVAVEQNDDPDGISASPLKDAVVTLPDGMATNPSAADGLKACSEDEISLGTDDEVACPNAAKIGTAELITPVLPDPVSGSVYLAEQGNKGPGQGSNPFDTLLAMYLVLKDKERGLLVKLPGKIEADPDTGQLTTRFTDNPQLPFSELTLSLKDGNRAPLVTPPTCGTKSAEAELTPWARPDEVVEESSSFEITTGPDGQPCPATLADRPFEPEMKAGVLDAAAGGFSPFVFRLTRDDGHQEILSTTVTPPGGVTAKLAGVPRCNNAQINLGKCPSKSRIGTTIVGAGAGPSPFYIQPPNEGKVFLTGPYKGAPLGMLIQVPAIAGPFDLGMVNVRASVEVDPQTAQLTVTSDEIPQILEGIPLRVRDIRVRIDRDRFTIAPTDCSDKQVEATVLGSHGATADLDNHFQAADCGDLSFDPSLRFTATGGKQATKRNQHPGLRAKLRIRQPQPFEGQTSSNISQVEVTLPKQLLLDQSSPAFTDVCTRPEYDAGNCPESSQVGTAVAKSPLLDQPLSGPVYLKTSDNLLPDLAADLGGIIDIDLFGRIDQDKGRIRNTFDIVPDVPVSSFELKLEGGADGVLVNANAGKGLCTSPKRRKIDVSMSAHNDARKSYSTMFKTKCGKKKGTR